MLLAAACGDDGPSKQIDASVIDGPDIDANLGAPVKLTITSNGTGVAGVRVHFQGPDSAVIASATTDANGVASSPVPAGGYVTANNPFAGVPGGTFADLKTFSGVQPGDELVLKDDFGGAGVDLDITAAVDSGGTVTGYRFSSPCDDSQHAQNPPTTPSYSMSLDSRCVPNTDLIVASHDTNDAVVRYHYAANVSTSGGTADLTASTVYVSSNTKTYTFNNMPANSDLEFGVEMHSNKGRVITFDAGGTGTAVAVSLKVTGFTGALELVFGGYPTMYGVNGIAQWAPFATAAFTVDAGALALRAATSGASFDVATKRAQWTEATAGVAPDFAVAELEIYRATGSLYVYWDVIAEAGAEGRVQYPTLPVEGGVDYNVLAGDMTETNVTVGKVPGGWNGIRAKFFALDGPADLAGGANAGTLVFQNIDDAAQLLAPMQVVSTHKRNVLAASKIRRRR
jgi:hypothetical protein